jgi:hypothetical protein
MSVAETTAVEPCGACGIPHDDERTGFTCVECGERHTRRWAPCMASELRGAKLCFNCHFWQEKVDWSNDPAERDRCVRVNGNHYHIGEEPTEEERRASGGVGIGYGGTKIRIRFNDGRVVETRNLWHQGNIPERFKGRLPDNASFIQPEEELTACLHAAARGGMQ